jgi:hypothetical protein
MRDLGAHLGDPRSEADDLAVEFGDSLVTYVVGVGHVANQLLQFVDALA